eukprot:m.403037 g.403037  ORF g.403037 m.403037 type:complete len:223 (+) comp28406_c1_seq68:2936-3604(+)
MAANMDESAATCGGPHEVGVEADGACIETAAIRDDGAGPGGAGAARRVPFDIGGTLGGPTAPVQSCVFQQGGAFTSSSGSGLFGSAAAHEVSASAAKGGLFMHQKTSNSNGGGSMAWRSTAHVGSGDTERPVPNRCGSTSRPTLFPFGGDKTVLLHCMPPSIHPLPLTLSTGCCSKVLPEHGVQPVLVGSNSSRLQAVLPTAGPKNGSQKVLHSRLRLWQMR